MFSSVSGPLGTLSSCFLLRNAAAAHGSSPSGRGRSFVAACCLCRSLYARAAVAAALPAVVPNMSIRGQRANQRTEEGPPLSHFGIAKPALISPPSRPLSIYPGCLRLPPLLHAVDAAAEEDQNYIKASERFMEFQTQVGPE